MAIQQLQYDDKEAINIDSTIPNKNKCNASDLNEIKSVVNGNSYETPKVSSQVDTDYKVNVLTTKNLFDKNTITNDKYIDDNGGIQTLSNVFISDYIPVQPNTKYAISGKNNHWVVSALYDINKNFISRVSDGSYITTTASTYYIITMGNPTDINTIQVEQGEVATTYEPFIQNTININNEKYTDTINVGTEINDKNRVNVLYSHNLFNKNTISVGQWLNADGTLSSNSDFSTSDFIPIVAGEQYYLPKTNTRRLKYYNSSKTPLTTSDWDIASGSDNQVLTIPNNASYVKITIQTNVIDINTFMFNEGSTALPYEPYIVPSINVDGEEIYNANIMTYDDTERVIGTWFDKPLYRKTINIGALTNATLKTTAHGISNIDLIVKVNGITYDSGYTYFPLPFSSKVANESISLYANRTNIYTNCGTDRTSFTNTLIILEYTKTTD